MFYMGQNDVFTLQFILQCKRTKYFSMQYKYFFLKICILKEKYINERVIMKNYHIYRG